MSTVVQKIRMVSDTSTFTQNVVLDGVEYVFSFRWNGRVSRWFFSVGSPDGTVLAGWQKVVADVPLLQRYATGDLPPGDLWIYDLEGNGTDPGLRDLAGRMLLVYVEAA